MAEVGEHIGGLSKKRNSSFKRGEAHNATWVAPNQHGRNIPDAKAEVAPHDVARKQGVIIKEIGKTHGGDLNNAKGVKANEHGRTIPNPYAEVGAHITGRRASIHDDLDTGEIHNATWVPENQFGRTIPNPMAEVGEHIGGLSKKRNSSFKRGEAHNATWVAPNQHGRTIPNPLQEQPHLHGNRADIGRSMSAGEAHNATWIAPNQHGRNIPNPMQEQPHIEGMSSQVVADIKEGKAHNATWAVFHKEVAKQSIKLEKQGHKREDMLARLLADQENARKAEHMQSAATDAAFDTYYQSKREQADSGGGATPVNTMPPAAAADGAYNPSNDLDDAYNDFFGKSNEAEGGGDGAAGAAVDTEYDTSAQQAGHADGSSTPTNVAGRASANRELAAIVKARQERGEEMIPVTRIGHRDESPAVWAKDQMATNARGGAVDLHALLDVRIMTPAAFRTETPYGFAPEDVQAILAKHSGIMADEYDSYSDSDSD